jgi:hypothetical protein
MASGPFGNGGDEAVGKILAGGFAGSVLGYFGGKQCVVVEGLVGVGFAGRRDERHSS